MGYTQRPRLAAVLAFEKSRARQLKPIELLILKITQLPKVFVSPRTNADSAPMLIVIASRQHSSKPLIVCRVLIRDNYKLLKQNISLIALSLFIVADILPENQFVTIIVKYREVTHQIFPVGKWIFDSSFIFHTFP